jgi:hypothetical protein
MPGEASESLPNVRGRQFGSRAEWLIVKFAENHCEKPQF